MRNLFAVLTAVLVVLPSLPEPLLAAGFGFGGLETAYLASMQELTNPADYWPPIMDGELLD